MNDSSIFGNFFSSVTGMGNPMTKTSVNFDPLEQELLKKADPTVALALAFNRKREDAYNDPDRLREQMQVYKEFRAEESANAAKIQAERDKRNFQYQLAASIPKTINEIGANLAQSAYNPLRLQILADTPARISQAYGALPRINIPSFR